MTNFNIQKFMDALTEEQRAKVMACKTNEQLEAMIKAENIDLTAYADEAEGEVALSLDDLEDVAGGKGFLQTAIASVLVFTGAAAAVAVPASTPLFSDTAITASAYLG